jgi:hypothetical protein
MTHIIEPGPHGPSHDRAHKKAGYACIALALLGVFSVLGGCDRADDGNELRKINGSVHVVAGQVPSVAETVNGGISIYGASRVKGGILVKRANGIINFGNNVPRIEIGPGATVQGDLRFEREVKLYVSDKATIGPVTGATPIPFTGDTAPAN